MMMREEAVCVLLWIRTWWHKWLHRRLCKNHLEILWKPSATRNAFRQCTSSKLLNVFCVSMCVCVYICQIGKTIYSVTIPVMPFTMCWDTEPYSNAYEENDEHFGKNFWMVSHWNCHRTVSRLNFRWTVLYNLLFPFCLSFKFDIFNTWSSLNIIRGLNFTIRAIDFVVFFVSFLSLSIPSELIIP